MAEGAYTGFIHGLLDKKQTAKDFILSILNIKEQLKDAEDMLNHYQNNKKETRDDLELYESFSDKQKEEYIKKIFDEKELENKTRIANLTQEQDQLIKILNDFKKWKPSKILSESRTTAIKYLKEAIEHNQDSIGYATKALLDDKLESASYLDYFEDMINSLKQDLVYADEHIVKCQQRLDGCKAIVKELDETFK